MYRNLHFYINFDCDEYVDKGDQYLITIKKMVESTYMHRASVFHFKEQLHDFISTISDLDKKFVHSTGNILSLILRNSIEISEKDIYIFNILFNSQGSCLQHIPMVQIKPNEKIAIISSKPNCYTKYLLYAKNQNEIELIKINILNTPNAIFTWIQNSIPRVFNKSLKHGENGKGNWPGESCLLCSSQQAQKLLDTSIPDFEEIDKRLFNYDSDHKTYIEFFYEGDNPQSQWHGFHLRSKDWNRVPQKAKNVLDTMVNKKMIKDGKTTP